MEGAPADPPLSSQKGRMYQLRLPPRGTLLKRPLCYAPNHNGPRLDWSRRGPDLLVGQERGSAVDAPDVDAARAAGGEVGIELGLRPVVRGVGHGCFACWLRL